MAGYDSYYSQYVPHSQSGAYDATFMSPNPRAEDFVLDASRPHTSNDGWNMSGGDPNALLQHNLLYNEPMNTITPQCGWQQQPDYFDASPDMFFDNWAT